MSRPFDRDIPRYPDEPGFPIEPTRDLPTAETSIFSDPSTAKSSELLTDYVSEASNSKTRASTIQNIISFCSIPEQQEAFARNLTSRMQNAEEIEGELSLRVTRYKEISEKLARHFETKTKTDTNSEEKGQVDDSQEDRYAILEPSTYQIPDKTISLVNECLKTTFLRDYGTTIPVLNKSDVLVVTDKSLKKFLHGLGRLETHPMRRIAGEELQRKMQRKESPFSQKESGLMVATDIAAPGAPILLPEVEIRSTAEYQEASQVEKRIVLEVVMGKTLLHESLHRVASFGEPIPVTPDSPLFRLAFASDRIGANYYTGKDERERKARLKMIGTLTNYASTHNPVVIIEGTRV
ncbi:hypothetical protein M1349_04400, partial [Patescibacteria group bacterium]|nr:hypothetical protein [Patescibacteria group bacterium]